MRFTGTIHAKIDVKGRVFFPAAFRKQFVDSELELILRRDVYQPCLVVYPVTVWEQEVSILRQRLNRWNPQEAMVFRQFLADAETVTLDASGRLLLSKTQMQLAALQKEVVFVGVDDRIELWSKESLEQPFLSDQDFGHALQQLMSTDK